MAHEELFLDLHDRLREQPVHARGRRLAREQRVELPSYTEGGLRETVYKERYTSLGDYLKGFKYTVAVMQNAESLERIAAELAEDNQAEGVRYLEVRFAPQLHVRPGLDAVAVIAAVVFFITAGLRGCVRSGGSPPLSRC